MRQLKLTMIPLIIFMGMAGVLNAQTKKTMDESVYSRWNRITGEEISNNGKFILYHLSPENNDQTAALYDADAHSTHLYNRAEDGVFDNNSEFAFFRIKPGVEELKELRRKNKKKKKEDLAKDSLLIVNLSTKQTELVPDMMSFRTGEKWGGYIIYLLEPHNPEPDSTEKKNTLKKESKTNGSKLIIRNLKNGENDTIRYVKQYLLAEDYPGILAVSSGDDITFQAGIYRFDCTDRSLHLLLPTEKDVENLSLFKDASKAAFHVDASDSNSIQKTHDLYLWRKTNDQAVKIAGEDSAFLPDNWKISQHEDPDWSEDGNRLHFGIRSPEIVQDTNLLEEEIVNVEIWNYQDDRLYTQQEVQANRERNRSYSVLYDLEKEDFITVGTEEYPEVRFGHKLNGRYALAYDETGYLKYTSWLGYAYKDLYKVDLHSGRSEMIGKKVRGSIRVSPEGMYFFWYSPPDSAWIAYDVQAGTKTKIAHNGISRFYDEENDRPELPDDYGYAGWTENDQFVLIYDRYDLWKIDPKGVQSPARLTDGREKRITYRFIDLDPDKETIDLQKVLLHGFDENDKSGGYAWYTEGIVTWAVKDNYRFSRNVEKAKDTDMVIYTRESFQQFPDILLDDLNFDTGRKISEANPFQDEYKWGTAEMYHWVDLNGDSVQGLLFKPEDFDPSKKYPLLVNFYEKNSDNLYGHRAPFAHRSTINYTFYVNRGYVIFNPDIDYDQGLPGNSCYNAVISGVLALIDEGFIDKDRIGVQGHSWGGYQIAHLLTKTDLFRCAEAGAPVVNMVSAYGGIRWGSGMSRMFQYEKTQSRIGGSLWEKPELYLENSPIFQLDRQTTPVLILHNDGDGAVPWYQGIEYFVALRRLGKPAWLLNYNEEPHWPLKWQNRLDFNIRMQQFFDHYLMDAPMPRWMEEGVPAIEKGINKGLELSKY